ncbi:hypothetical protein Tco_1069053 [Tanacetum coccineum]|uniref:Uncharacterized protein n=1 Tax=Tanacetum coccineum TaxID=301880 RepID=A0ABQ5HHM8_9ASTR
MENSPPIQYGLTPHPLITDLNPNTVCCCACQRGKKHCDSEFSVRRKQIEMDDNQAEIILQSRSSRPIFNNLNQTSTAKEDLEKCEMLMQGSDFTQLNIHKLIRQNTKFVHNIPALLEVTYEPHAKKTLKKQEQSTSIVDPLAYVAHTTTAPVLPSPSTSNPQPTAQSPIWTAFDPATMTSD